MDIVDALVAERLAHQKTREVVKQQQTGLSNLAQLIGKEAQSLKIEIKTGSPIADVLVAVFEAYRAKEKPVDEPPTV